MKKIHQLTILFIVLAASTNLNAADYIVSDAGSSEVNGTYTESGTYNGKLQYRLGITSFYLRYNDWMGPSRWEIWDDDMMETYYYTDVAGDTPPSSGWMNYYGMAPVPTILPAGPTLAYSTTTFAESTANNGAIGNSLSITYTMPGSDYFTGSNGTFAASKYTATNVPAGLTMVITKNSNTELSVSLTSTATSHNNANDISNLQIAFNNTAFYNGDASAVTNSTKSGIIINFIQQYEVAASGGDYTTIEAAVAVARTGDIINIAAGTYTENELIINYNITIQGQGANSTIIQAAASYNTATHRVFQISYNITTTIKNVTIRYGKTTDSGGGIFCVGNLILKNSSVCDNISSSGYGGGFFGGTSTITNCLFNHNSANTGGAIYGNVNISNSTITANSATAVGGGIYQQSSYTANITNCTITNNTAGTYGAGIFSNWGTLTITNTIISDNGSSDYYVAYGITLTDNGYNVIKNQTYLGSPTNWKFSTLSDILNNYKADGSASTSWNRNNAELGNQNLNLSATLADNNTLNGTQTLALLGSSFAIDAGTGTGTDQRGAPVYGTKDIGAYEYNSTWTIWTGGTSTAWETSGNWSTNVVPTASNDVTIPDVVNDPLISTTTSADCNNLAVISGGSLTIESSTSGTGSLIVSGTSTGNVTCQRYMTGGKWHLVSPTASGGSISTFIQAAGNAIPSKDVSGTLNYGIMDYNETPNLWNSYFTAATPGNFVAGKGYSLRRTGDGIVSFTGTVTSGTKTVSLTKAGEGWNCVGNPFTSAINMNTAASASNNFLKTNAIDVSNLDPSYACLYVWDDAVAAYKIIGNISYGVRDLGQNVFAPGQGFFVKANNSSSSVQFTAAMQTHQPTTELKAGQVSWPGFELTATSGNIKASTVVAFNKAMTNGLDPTYDAGLLRGSSGISIYTRLVLDNSVDFAIQCLPENQNLVIPLGLDCTKGGSVRFSVATSSLPKTCSIILEDRTNKTFTQLDNGKELVVTIANNTKGTGRFFIYINYTGLGTSKLLSTGTFNLKVYPANGLIWIIGEVDIAARAYLYDMKGRNRGTFTLQKGSVNNLSAKGLAPGIYLLSVTEGNKRYTTKIVMLQN